MGPCSLAELHTWLTLPLERLIPVQPFTRHARTLCVPGWDGSVRAERDYFLDMSLLLGKLPLLSEAAAGWYNIS